MKVRAVLAVFTAILVAPSWAAEIGIGDDRAEVLDQLGKPTSIARRGDHEIFLYPKGGRIEFMGGKVATVRGPLPAPAPIPAPAPASPTESPASGAPEDAPIPAPTPKTKSAALIVPPSDDYNPAIAANELAKHVEKMDTAWGPSPTMPKQHSPLDSIPSFLTGLLLRFGFTVLALKLAFKYWEMDAFWTGILAIAGIDLALHASFELLGAATGGFTTLAVVENGIPGLVMIYTINRFCFNKRIQNAVLTAAAVKLVVMFCYVFAGLAALNLIYH